MRLILFAVLAAALARAVIPALRAPLAEALSHFHATDPEAAVAGVIDYLCSFGLWAPSSRRC